MALAQDKENTDPYLETGENGEIIVVIPWDPPTLGSSKVPVKETTGREYRKSKRIHNRSSLTHSHSKSVESEGECEGEVSKEVDRDYSYGRECLGGTEYVCLLSVKTTTSKANGEVCATSVETRIDCWSGYDCEW